MSADVRTDGLPAFDRVDAFGYRLFGLVFDEESATVSRIERKLTQAAIAEPVEMYLSRSLAAGFVVGTAGGAIALSTMVALGGLPAGDGVPVAWAVRTLAVTAVVGLLGVAIVTSVALGRLYYRADEREREIDVLLPDAIAYMYALSTGGLNEVEIVEAMAEAEDTYGEVAREFQRIVRETSYFDVDYRTAIREQALVTPSDGLSEFLTDTLSILNSGGDLEDFLDDQREKHVRTARREQESTLETLELLGELYIALSLFPLLLIILLVIMGIMGNGRLGMLYATVYGLIPVGNLAFLVLVSMLTRDDPGDGYVDAGRPDESGDRGGADRVPDSAAGRTLSERLARGQWWDELRGRIAHPHASLLESPTRVLWVTAPLTLAVLAHGIASGDAPTSLAGFSRDPIVSTAYYVYAPLYLNGVPLALFHEWDLRRRRPITGDLSDALRKLSSANDTGLSLLESIETVAETSSGKLAGELGNVCAKVRYGRSLREALVEFANEYHVPRLARSVTLVSKAQETSNHITKVLTTAAQASETRDELERERRSRTRLQVVVIVMTYFTMLGVIVVLRTQFLDVMTGVMSSTGDVMGIGASIATGSGSPLGLLLFHAVTIQAVLSGFICGYIREGSLASGLKYVVVLASVALGVWLVVG